MVRALGLTVDDAMCTLLRVTDQFTDMYMYMAKYCTLHNLRDPLDGIIGII